MLNTALTLGYSSCPSQSSWWTMQSPSVLGSPHSIINTGAHPTTPVSMMHGGTSKSSQMEAVKETLKQMKIVLAEAQTNLERAQCRMAKCGKIAQGGQSNTISVMKWYLVQRI